MQLIGLSGPAGVGKDEIADQLVSMGYLKFSFSDSLYTEVAEAFGVDEDLLRSRDTKELPTELLSMGHCKDLDFVEIVREHVMLPATDNIEAEFMAFPTSPRWVLQRWGTEYRRKQDPDYWVKKADKFVEVFLDGLVEERDAEGVPTKIREHMGLVNTSVRFDNEREWLKSLDGILWHVSRPGYPRSADNNYISERGLFPATGDTMFINNGSIEELRTSVSLVLAGNQIVIASSDTDKTKFALVTVPFDALPGVRTIVSDATPQ